ncbi:hypothetical protein ACOIOT_003358 [Cronobacter turicensis]
MSKENIDYRAIVERIAELLHGGVTDIGLLTVTVQSYKDRLVKVEAERDALAAELSVIEGIHDKAVLINDEQFNQCPPEVQAVIRSLACMQIPSPAAFLREVRAQGVEMFSKQQRSYIGNPSKNDAASSYCSREALKFSVQLRQGGAA